MRSYLRSNKWAMDPGKCQAFANNEMQACFLIDNSQGHSAYSEDALLTSRMNFRPGGSQAHMRDGWYMRDGQRVSQP